MRHPTDLAERGEISILFIAGNATFRPVVTRFLERCDELSLVGTVAGSDNIMLRALDLCPQVILLDMDTSDQTGLTTIADLRVVLPEAGLIALSLLGADGYRQAVLVAGANDLVLKSKLRTDLLPAIRRAVHDGRDGQEWASWRTGDHA